MGFSRNTSVQTAPCLVLLEDWSFFYLNPNAAAPLSVATDFSKFSNSLALEGFHVELPSLSPNETILFLRVLLDTPFCEDKEIKEILEESRTQDVSNIVHTEISKMLYARATIPARELVFRIQQAKEFLQNHLTGDIEIGKSTTRNIKIDNNSSPVDTGEVQAISLRLRDPPVLTSNFSSNLEYSENSRLTFSPISVQGIGSTRDKFSSWSNLETLLDSSSRPSQFADSKEEPFSMETISMSCQCTSCFIF